MDGITLAAVAAELRRDWIGARVEKVYQPERDELNLLFRGHKERLIANANPGHARVQISALARENPAEPPMFCMLLRKLLTGSRLVGVEQPGFDRVLSLVFEGQDELANECRYELIAEIMGKHSNVILVREDGRIADAIKHVTPAISSVRVVMPGQAYLPAPSQGKRNPIEAGREDVAAEMARASGRLDRWIGSTWSGISPDMAREIALRAAQEGAVWEALDEAHRAHAIESIAAFFGALRDESFKPTVVKNEFGEVIAAYPIEPMQYGAAQWESYNSMSRALDVFYEQRDLAARMKQKSASITRLLQQNLERCQKKLGIQTDILAQGSKREEYRLFGELLTANLYRLSRGQRTVVVENYYDPAGGSVEIPLDERLGPGDNAQRYFKKYNKLKVASDLAGAQIEALRTEIDYLEGLQESVQLCTTSAELAEIRQELVDQGYARVERGAKKRAKAPKNAPSQALHFVSSDGADIFVGKNNAQNDRLTLRFAQGDDVWLHAKGLPGSHVIVRAIDGAVSDVSLQEAAELAAYFSKARHSSQVAIDYTPRKFLKKPPGSPPGFVTFSTNKTAYVTPDLGKLRQMVCKTPGALHWQ